MHWFWNNNCVETIWLTLLSCETIPFCAVSGGHDPLGLYECSSTKDLNWVSVWIWGKAHLPPHLTLGCIHSSHNFRRVHVCCYLIGSCHWVAATDFLERTCILLSWEECMWDLRRTTLSWRRWWWRWRGGSGVSINWTSRGTESPFALTNLMFIIGIRQCGAPWLGIFRSIPIKGAGIVEDPIKSEWKYASPASDCCTCSWWHYLSVAIVIQNGD